MRLLATDGAGSGFVEKAKPGCGAIYGLVQLPKIFCWKYVSSNFGKMVFLCTVNMQTALSSTADSEQSNVYCSDISL